MSWRVFLLPFFLLPMTTFAQNVGVIVRTVSEPPADQQAVEALLAEAAATKTLVPAFDLLMAARNQYGSGAVRRERLVALQKASDARHAAWRRYLAAEPEQAQALLAKARKFLIPALDLDGAQELLADISLRLGAVHLFIGQKLLARQAFAMAARLDERRPVASPQFSRQVVTAHQVARRAPVDAPVSLDVRTQPGARVQVNGRVVSQMPVRLAPGEYVVVVRKKGFVSSGQIVAVVNSQVIDVILVADDDAAVLANDTKYFAVGLDAATTKTLLERAMVFAELDEAWLIGVTWQRGTLSLLGQKCMQQPLRCGPVKEVSLLEEVVDEAGLRVATNKLVDEWKDPGENFADPVVFEDTRLLSPNRPKKPPRVVTKKRWWKNPWVWIGAAAAAGVITSTVIVLGDDGVRSTRVLVPGCTFGGC